MGVLACDRQGCENIMCNRYSPTYGYICNDCIEELAASGDMNIQIFMNTPKNQEKELWHYFSTLDTLYTIFQLK